MSIYGPDNVRGLATELTSHQLRHKPGRRFGRVRHDHDHGGDLPIVDVAPSPTISDRVEVASSDAVMEPIEDQTAISAPVPVVPSVHIELQLPDMRRAVVRGRTVIGRTGPTGHDATTRHIQISDPTKTVSKMHVVLDPFPAHGGTWVTDLESTNGTSIIDKDGQVIALTPKVEHWVSESVTLQVGDLDLVLEIA